MKHKVTFLGAAFFLISTLSAQFKTGWIHAYERTNSEAASILQVGSHLYFAGVCRNSSYLFDGQPAPFSFGYDDGILAATDLSGNVNWLKMWGDGSSDAARFCKTNNGNIYVGGQFSNGGSLTSLGVDSVFYISPTHFGRNAGYASKLDTFGNVEWVKIVPGYVASMQLDSAGNCFVLWDASDSTGFWKISPNGTILLTKMLVRGIFTNATNLSLGNNNEIYVTSVFRDSALFGGSMIYSVQKRYNHVFAKFSGTGSLLFTKVISVGGSSVSAIRGLHASSTGKVWLTGWAYDSIYYDNALLPGNGYYFFLAETDEQGNLQNFNNNDFKPTKYFGASSAEILETRNHELYIPINFSDTLITPTDTLLTNAPGGWLGCGVVTKWSSTGQLQWYKPVTQKVGGRYGAAAVHLSQPESDTIYICGHMNSSVMIDSIMYDTLNYKIAYTGMIVDTTASGPPVESNLTSINSACGFPCTGSITVTPISGTPPFQYQWQPSLSNGATISNICAGFYYVTVTDAFGDTAAYSASITQPGNITASVTSVPSTDCNSNTGSATVSAVTGFEPYTYLWSNGANTATITNLATGSYPVTLTDAHGCAGSAVAIVNSASAVLLSLTSTTSTCGENNGSAMAGVLSGSPPYVFTWSSGGSTQTISNLSSGVYNVTVTGSGNCSASASVTVPASDSISLMATSTNAVCGNVNGTASVNVVAGVAPYTYAWSNGETTSAISNLPADTYTVIVTDSDGCEGTASATVSATAGVSLTPSSINTTCGTSNGSASVAVSTGTPPYIFIWNNGNTTQTISNVSSGTYGVTVTADGNCTASAVITIAASVGVSLSASSVHTTCGNNNGEASVNVITGIAPFTYVWNGGETDSVITNLSAGDYIVSVTDYSGCSATARMVVNPSGGNTVSLTADKTEMCVGDSALICAPNGYLSYQWNTGQNTRCFYTSADSSYYVTVTDNSSCTATSDTLSVTVYSSPSVFAGANGDTLFATAASTYQWYLNGNAITDATSSIYIVTQGGSYTVIATDNNGCTATSNAVVISGINNVDDNEGVNVYPNPNDFGFWILECGSNYLNGEVELIDAKGRVVFQSKIINLKSEISPDVSRGVYLLHINSHKSSVVRKLIRL